MTKFKELSTKKKLRLIGIASILFAEVLFLGMLVGSNLEDTFDFSLNDMISDFTIMFIAEPLFEWYYDKEFNYDYEQNKIIIPGPENEFNTCDKEFLKYNQPLDAHDAVLNGTLTCTPSDHIQSIIDFELELINERKGGLVVAVP